MKFKNLNYDPHKLLEEDLCNDVSVNKLGSDICDFFDKKSVFITGATGFLGKVLVEKLLRSCGDTLDTLYILCREKKGKDIKERLAEIYNNTLFKKLEKLHPNFREKIVAIPGDAALANFGISDNNRTLLTEKVSIIFHIAATVRFDEKIKQAVALNIKATRTVLDLARDCKKLESFVHCSTAFSNCPQKHVKEEVYEAFIDTDAIINIVESTPECVLDKITPYLLGDWPNTYSYTKAIAESTVKQYGQGLPVCIFRPSMVISTYQEPIRGWIDNMYGPTGIVAGVGLGVIQTLHCDPEVNAEMVPVDMVVNGMIAAAYKNSIETCHQDIPVYNYVSFAENPIKWRDFDKSVAHYGSFIPSILSMWIYNLTMNKHKVLHLLYVAVMHFLPAFLLDGICIAMGKKPQLVKAYKKVYKFSNAISYFSTRDWTYGNENVQKLWQCLSDVDKKNFYFNIKTMDWDYHSQFHGLGLRLYLVHDDLKTLPIGKKLIRRYSILHNAIKIILCACFIWTMYSIMFS